jgi:hypothetical protein
MREIAIEILKTSINRPFIIFCNPNVFPELKTVLDKQCI